MNITGLVKMSAATLAFVMISAGFSIKANDEISRLDELTNNMETALIYKAPSVDATMAAEEVNIAIDRLDRLTNAAEASVKYTATEVNADIVAFELATAFESLDNITMAAEQSIIYSAPAAAEAGICEVQPALAICLL